ncbi:MAG TPA: urocanate hydratase [Solirubrobacteraceae bacterium]|nr:urocanate hydratase [Solirubrobacteraceae bacterium]
MTAVAGQPRVVRAATGTRLRCRGWRQEGILRMLENTVQNGEAPEELIIYGGTGQAARNWRCFDVIVESLHDLEGDETLVIQSGKPVARFRTHEDAPRVLTANSHLVGRWANWDTFHELKRRGLIMFGQYTAGAWEYIGQQGILQSTYETLAECARHHFGGSLSGRLVLTAGLGAMGGAQPLAIKFLGGVALVVEVDEEHADRRLASGYLEHKAHSVEEALRLCNEALSAGTARSVGLVANAADVLPDLVKSGLRPDVVTDQTSAHDARFGYVPSGYSVAEVVAMRDRDPARVERDALDSIAHHVQAMVEFQAGGAVVFEYGNAIREQAQRAGLDDAFAFQGFIPLFIRPNFCVARGPVRWVTLSGDPTDLAAIDDAVLERFGDDPAIANWITIAKQHVPLQGLPARTSWLDLEQRWQFGSMVNEMVAGGRLSAPVAMTRDHLDAGSVAQPTRETENMADGSDPVADWPVLNALLNCAGGADLVALHQGGGSGMGGSISAGFTLVIDGTDATQRRIDRVLRTDPGIGVVRHADAGYAASIEVARERGLKAPMLGAESGDS